MIATHLPVVAHLAAHVATHLISTSSGHLILTRAVLVISQATVATAHLATAAANWTRVHPGATHRPGHLCRRQATTATLTVKRYFTVSIQGRARHDAISTHSTHAATRWWPTPRHQLHVLHGDGIATG